jgi:hypothetical protein
VRGREGERSTCNTVILPKSTTHQTSYLRVPYHISPRFVWCPLPPRSPLSHRSPGHFGQPVVLRILFATSCMSSCAQTVTCVCVRARGWGWGRDCLYHVGVVQSGTEQVCESTRPCMQHAYMDAHKKSSSRPKQTMAGPWYAGTETTPTRPVYQCPARQTARFSPTWPPFAPAVQSTVRFLDTVELFCGCRALARQVRWACSTPGTLAEALRSPSSKPLQATRALPWRLRGCARADSDRCPPDYPRPFPRAEPGGPRALNLNSLRRALSRCIEDWS